MSKVLGMSYTAVMGNSPFKCLLCSYQTAHIWACPPSEGDDYIYHCHPPEQKIPKPRSLQKWLRKMIEQAKDDGIVNEWKVYLSPCCLAVFLCVMKYSCVVNN